MAYIEMKHSYKRYQVGESEIVANNDINFAIEKGELVIILGSSGAGKSTVLNILGGMDTNDEGQVIIDGKDISGYSAKELTTYRRNDVGFVFQFYNLVPNLTAKENVELASEIVVDARDATETLADVGLEKRINNFPAQLSGGEQQRVSIARAVAKNPKLLLCDEPTGALDYQTGKQVLKILQNMSRKEGATVIIVTHNSALAPIADRVIHMHDARVSSIELNSHPQDIDTFFVHYVTDDVRFFCSCRAKGDRTRHAVHSKQLSQKAQHHGPSGHVRLWFIERRPKRVEQYQRCHG